MELWQEFKNNIAVALLFLLVGFIAGLSAYNYLSDFFNADVVLKGSYVYKTDIQRNYVVLDKYQEAISTINELKKKNLRLEESLSNFSISICDTYAREVDSLTNEQRKIEKKAEDALSLFTFSGRKKDVDRVRADQVKSIELRKYSAQLNEQLIQIREKLSKCIK